MALRTQVIPSPAYGADWSYTVPGKYLIDVRAITGTFQPQSLPAVPTETDVTGHGNTLAYTFASPVAEEFMLGQVGAVAGNAAITVGNEVTRELYGHAFRTAGSTMDWTGDFTVVWWSRSTGSATDTDEMVLITKTGFGTVVQLVRGATQLAFILNGGVASYRANGAYVADGAWHRYTVSYTAASVAGTKLYRDGVLIAWTSVPVSNPSLPVGVDVTEFCVSPGGSVPGAIDEAAAYPVALSGAQDAAQYAAAAAGITAYTAAVLADHPAWYYHFDAQPTTAPKLVALTIDNGRDVVGIYPSTAQQPINEYATYSWLGNAKGTPGSFVNATSTISLPQLLLPAGYTIASRTLNIQPNDLWIDISLWWDDTAMIVGGDAGSIDPYAYPPGAFLVYQQQGT